MDLDDLLVRYFGTADATQASAAVQASGLDRLRVEFALERDRGHRFALWSLLHMLGEAPAIDFAFADQADRAAARRFASLAARADER